MSRAATDRRRPGLAEVFFAAVRRDLLLAWRRPGDVLNPLLFCAMVVTLFPLAVGPERSSLLLSGPGVLWVAALLALLLSLNKLFASDLEDGSLEQLLVSPQPLPLIVLGKTLAHWLTSGVPLVAVSPLLAISYQMPGNVIGALMLTLTPGTIVLSLLGTVGAALTVGLNRPTALLSLLVLPLAMPVLILGANTVSLAAGDERYTPGLWALAAYAVAALSLAPFAAAAALRLMNE